MAVALLKCAKKRGDGRPRLNREDSVQRTTKNPLSKEGQIIFTSACVIFPRIFPTKVREMPHTTQFEGSADPYRTATEENDQQPKYQNSYRLESQRPFKVDSIDKIVEQVMTNNLEDIVYDPKECPRLCAEISADIRDRVCRQNLDRYKIVVIVTINEKASQTIQTAMKFVWDVQRDNYSSFTFETRTFFAYCCVFGVYCE